MGEIIELALRPDVTVVAVPLPNEYNRFDAEMFWENDCMSFVNAKIPLPPGQYEIVGLLREIPEEQAKNLIEEIHVEIPPHPSNDFGGDWRTAYVDYENPGEFAGWNGDAGYCDTATDSLKSAIKANGGDPEQNWLLLKKIQ